MAKYLFHKMVYMPKGLDEYAKNIQSKLPKIEQTEHIVEQAEKYKHPIGGYRHNYNVNKVMSTANTLQQNPVLPFEVEVESNPFKKNAYVVTKFVTRQKYDDKDDVAIAVGTFKRHYGLKCKYGRNEKSCPIQKFVLHKYEPVAKTAWLNRSNDTHTTLKPEKYDTKLGGKK